ncbi:MAG: hypothetical protein V2A76_11865 [Planctomycetota bacterium]
MVEGRTGNVSFSSKAAKRDWVRLSVWGLTVLVASGLLFAGFVHKPRPNVDTLVSGASTLISMGLLEGARVDLEEVIQREPDHPQANLLFGFVLQAEGEYGRALQHYERGESVVVDSPDPALRADYYVTVGLLRLASGDFAGAESEALQLEKAGLRLPAAFLIRSFSRLGAGDDTSFQTGLERAYLLDPTDPIFRLSAEFLSEAIPWSAAYLIRD